MKRVRNLLLAIVVLITTIMLTGCGKKAISANDFKTKMKSKEYTVVEVTDQFASYSYIEKVYIAQDKTKSYQIEFYKLSDESYAKSFYNTNKQIFENAKSSSSAHTEVNLSNYSKYTQESNNKYSVISRIENTAVYLNVDSKYKDDVKAILKELGY